MQFLDRNTSFMGFAGRESWCPHPAANSLAVSYYWQGYTPLPDIVKG